jgi:hypothetical protein
MWEGYNPSDLRVQISMTELTNVDVATLSAEKRRDDDEEVVYCPYRLRFHLCNYACVGATVCKRRGMREMGAQGVDAR